MKICVVGLDQASPDIIFQDERLLNIRRLADAGLYGLLDAAGAADPWKSFETSQSPVPNAAASLWNVLAQQKTVLVPHTEETSASLSKEKLLAASERGFAELKQSLSEAETAGASFIDRGINFTSDGESADVFYYYLSLDEQIGGLMEALDDQTVLLLLSVGTPSHPGFFVLVSPNCPMSGEHDGATVLDLAPTVLDLAGYEIPSSMQGRSLVAGMEKRVPSKEDHEKILYDRLAGLGYV
jgi:predicted AlkP superfamily phosphohydrolase/phosphomutase